MPRENVVTEKLEAGSVATTGILEFLVAKRPMFDQALRNRDGKLLVDFLGLGREAVPGTFTKRCNIVCRGLVQKCRKHTGGQTL
jgi:hypothetical protein